MNIEEEFDGQLFINHEDEAAAKRSFETEVFFESLESHPFEMEITSIDKAIADRTIYSKRLARWKDISTPPQVRNKCVKTCRTDFPPIKFCCGWRVQIRWMENIATLIVKTSVPHDIEKLVKECMEQAAIVGAIAAIISGGSVAVAAAEKTFYLCLEQKIGKELLNVQIQIKSSLTSWS